MAKHRLVWRKGRATPIVAVKGKPTPKGRAGGKIIASRAATQDEERRIRRGEWIRTRPPGNPGKESSVRKGRRKAKNRP